MNMKKIVLALAIASLSSVGMAAFAAAPTLHTYSENRDYPAVVVPYQQPSQAAVQAAQVYSENADYPAVIVPYHPSAKAVSPAAHVYSENGDHQAALAVD